MSFILDIWEVSSVEMESAYGLGQAVRRARLRQGLSQQQLADRVGLSRQWLVQLEQGKANPTWDLLLRLMSALDLRMKLETDVESGGTVSDVGAHTTDLDKLLNAHMDLPR